MSTISDAILINDIDEKYNQWDIKRNYLRFIFRIPPEEGVREKIAHHSAASGGRKRRCWCNDSRIVTSGIGIAQLAVLLTAQAEVRPSTHPSNKCSAASLAEERGLGTPTSQRLVPPARKRKKKRQDAVWALPLCGSLPQRSGLLEPLQSSSYMWQLQVQA